MNYDWNAYNYKVVALFKTIPMIGCKLMSWARNNQNYRIFHPKQEKKQAYFQIQIMKQNKQKKEYDTCETKIQQDFITKNK